MTTYERALAEYEKEGENGQVKLVYSYFGLGIYVSQCLEEHLTVLLWLNRIIKKQIKSNTEVNEIIDAIEKSKKTLGMLLNEVKLNYEISEEHAVKLNDVLERRN